MLRSWPHTTYRFHRILYSGKDVPLKPSEWSLPCSSVVLGRVDKGQAVFQPVDSITKYKYREDGVLCQQEHGNGIPFYREYFYSFDAHNQTLEVTFDDGRPFYSCLFESDINRSYWMARNIIHYCGQDVYKAIIEIQAHHWWTVWQVQGPSKDYCIWTHYEKVT